MAELTVDRERTIPAGLAFGQIHVVEKAINSFVTLCGITIPHDQLLVWLQRPDEISCPKCAELNGQA